ncbi:MAG TPA: class I SAM-dependent methyltransferase [Phenylobacterium sp.]|uniref:class I SAM-dependent methyltransferase n=1 Tax=Phenylobacterium sp. TaxID=1871053 RepID=UPI002C4C2783|nr:class I SAM-dependent methyltransferase [Phenylobacterium sp.]HSV02496.1 class I SAM-dependent methyltransferase [Phenylobacterium sp.]
MDYDRTRMPEAYDRGRAMQPGVLALWLDELASLLPRRPERIVDLGCGTGRFSGGLANGYAAQVIGVDPSEKMLREARAKDLGPDVSFRTGSAEAIPVESGWADLVFMSMVFHHIGDRPKAAAECGRVLAPGGCVAIRGPTREQAHRVPLNGYFEGFEALYLARMPSLAEIAAPFQPEGFRPLGHKLVEQVSQPDWTSFVERTTLRADSLLASLPDAAFEAGLGAMRARPTPGPVRDWVDLVVLQRP